MADFRDLFTPRAIAFNWTNDPFNQNNYMGADLFPSRKKVGLDLSWIKGSRGLPISLMPSAFDAQATYRDRLGIELTETEMPFFREGYKIKEKDRQELVRVQSVGDAYANAVIQRIYDDVNDLIRGARVARERMVTQLLFPEEGNIGIKFKANGTNYTYNYDPNGTWKQNNYFALTSTDMWTATSTADPFNTFETVKKAVRSNTGSTPVIAVMNSNTFSTMAKCDAIKNRYISVNNVSLAYLTDDEVKRIVEATCGISIVLNDERYKDESKTSHAFVPDNYVAMIPGTDNASPLGNMWMSATPEEIDLAGEATAEVAIVDTGVAITQIVTTHPVNINTYASMIALPSYERMDECALIKVA